MSMETSMGTCNLCGESFSRQSMTRHLKTCGLAGPRPVAATGKPRSQCFHLFAEGRYDKEYWLHMAVPVDATLNAVDYFLRTIWVECCEHLSAFTIKGRRYAYQPLDELEESGMGVRLRRILHPGTVFSYEYDYGSTTELNLKVLGLRERGSGRGTVQLLARNHAPQTPCDRCKSQPATKICVDCQWKDMGWLCEDCAAQHACGAEMWLSVVNSPRVGVCAYCG